MADIQDPLRRENERNREILRERQGGGWGWLWAWWWIWIIIILIFGGWFGGWGWGGYGGWWGWGGARRTVVMQPIVLENNTLATLTSPSKSSYIGKQVTLNSVEVQGSAGNNAWWVGPDNTQELLITLPANVHPTQADGSQATINQGDLVNIAGMVQKAPSAQQAEQQWGINNDAASRLDAQGVYVAANSLVKAQGR